MSKKVTIVISVLLVAAILSGFAGVAAAKNLNQTTGSTTEEKVTRTITVNGTGKSYLTPNIAYVTLGVHTEGKDAAKAVNDNTTQAQKVKEAILAMGVEEKDIQTTNFSIYPQQQYDPQTGRPTGDITYTVDNILYITVRDLDTIGELLDVVVKAGVNTVSGIQFDAADRSEAESQARKLAVEDAEMQATELAQAAGVSLGDVQTISSYNIATPIYEKGMGGAAAMVSSDVPVSPGQLVIQVDVSVVYAIK